MKIIALFLFFIQCYNALIHHLNNLQNAINDLQSDQATEIISRITPQIAQTNDTTIQSKFYCLYALYHFYGLKNAQFIDFTQAYYWFKKSADLGNTQALFYTGLFGTYKLDGTFNVYNSIENNGTNYTKLENYVTFKHLSIPLMDFYFSAIQNEEMSQITLGFKYMQGLGTQKNCSTAVLYLNSLAQENLINKARKEKYLIQERRIDHLQYNTQFFTTLDLIDASDDHALIFENIMLVTKDSYQDVMTLAINYYYGINGFTHDSKKAFKIFSKVVEDFGTAQAKAFLGSMILEGIGSETQDYQQAFTLLKEAAAYNDSLALNGLGYMYLNGIQVQKDTGKALYYFKKAADLRRPDANFNYGSLFLLPSTREIDRNAKLAFHHLNMAASQGHPYAQYSLALIFLDGTDVDYNCELGAKLLHQAVSNGPWARHLNQGNYLFKKQQYAQSFVKNLEASTLGYHFGIVNAANLADLYQIISDDNVQYDLLEEKLLEDNVYQSLKHQLPKNAFEDLFQDYISLADRNIEYVRDLMRIDKERKKTIDKYIANKLYGYCKIEEDGSCFLKFGDFYYYGIFEDQDFNSAFQQYQMAAQALDTIEVIQAHAYFNLGYMTTLGLGIEKNHTLALRYFNQSIHKYPLIPGVSAEFVLFIVDIFTSSVEEILDDINQEKILESIEHLGLKFLAVIETHSRVLLSFTFGVCLLCLYGYKVKLESNRRQDYVY